MNAIDEAPEVLVTCLPMSDALGVVRAYEVVAESLEATEAEGDADTEMALLRTLHAVVNVIGLDTLVGDQAMLFVRVTAVSLSRREYLVLPAERAVLILPAPSIGASTLEADCDDARRRGYLTAVTWNAGAGKQAPQELAAGYVRVALGDLDETALADLARRVHAGSGRVVAVNADDRSAAARAVKAGCDLIQGRHFLAPEAEVPRQIRGIAAVHVRLLAQLSEHTLDLRAIGQTIELDLALVHGLLRRVNAAAQGLRQRVTSIGHALTMLGTEHIRAWGTLWALASLKGDRPSELVLISLVRARFCRQLAETSGRSDQSFDAYLVGLFSVLDVILAMPMEEAIRPLVLGPAVVRALASDRSGPSGQVLSLVEACERGAWTTVQALRERLGLSHAAVTNAYYQSLGWAREMLREPT